MTTGIVATESTEYRSLTESTIPTNTPTTDPQTEQGISTNGKYTNT
jgi:hypothetical protein